MKSERDMVREHWVEAQLQAVSDLFTRLLQPDHKVSVQELASAQSAYAHAIDDADRAYQRRIHELEAS